MIRHGGAVVHLADSLNAAHRGEPIPNRADILAGYRPFWF